MVHVPRPTYVTDDIPQRIKLSSIIDRRVNIVPGGDYLEIYDSATNALLAKISRSSWCMFDGNGNYFRDDLD